MSQDHNRQRLRALIVEDSEADFELILRTLKKGGFETDAHRVCSAEELDQALAHASWDIILSDYYVPGFGALQAMETVKAHGVNAPLVVVSGAVGEETAVEVMHAGASDFVMKGNLGRLPLVVERELKESKTRYLQKKADAQFKTLLEASKVLFSSLDYKKTVASIAKFVLPHFADWFVFDILVEDGTISRIAVEHVDAKLQEVADRLKKYPPKKEFSTFGWNVINSRQPRLEKEILLPPSECSNAE